MKLTTRAFLRLLACSVFLVVPLVAQGPFYGYNDFAFQNTTGKGTASLTARVFYPATRTGRGAPLVTRSGGHPVVVCLHGYSALGSYYTLLARHFAYRGYVVVLPNTAQYSGSTQVNDAIALFGALTVANGQSNHFLEGALNLKKVGLTGHSMGGGSTFRVLAANPGFVCGIGIAPVYPGSTIMRRVTVPVGTMHGKGDTVLGWSSHSLPLFSNATGYASLKFFYLFNSSCDHNNLAGFSQTTQASRDVWARSVRILNGFFDRYLKNIPAGLEEAVGTTARGEAKLDTLYVAVRKPEIWFTGVPDIGKVVQPTVLCEPGPALIATSVSTVSIPTSFGLLRLDPATLALVHLGTVGSSRLLAPKFTIPNDASLRGAKFPLQGLGQDVTRKTVLTGLVTLTIN